MLNNLVRMDSQLTFKQPSSAINYPKNIGAGYNDDLGVSLERIQSLIENKNLLKQRKEILAKYKKVNIQSQQMPTIAAADERFQNIGELLTDQVIDVYVTEQKAKHKFNREPDPRVAQQPSALELDSK